MLKADAEIGGAAVIALQEVDRNRKRSQNTNTARVIAEALGMNYTWAAPPPAPTDKRSRPDTREEETGVALLSPYSMTDVSPLLLPHEGPGGRRRVALGATIHLGATQVRAYSVHAETRVSVEEKIDQLNAVLEDLARFPLETPAVVLGDFNTWQPDSKRDTIRLFTRAGFATPFPPGQPTFRHMLVRFRLDWIWLRGFAPATAHGIARHVEISDHYPLWLETSMLSVAVAKP
jgi:endonuclease/exonuclease/phosphatase family metal-dependent hydrolase